MKTKTPRPLKSIDSALDKAISYREYRELIDRLLEAGKTTGNNHSDKMIEYTLLNRSRMNKWDKHYQPSDDARKVFEEWESDEIWLLITEAWCGDAAHSVPIIHKLASLSAAIDLRLVLRDENLELMDQFLTNGGRSIPKLIRLDKKTKEVLGTWGPRPEEARELMESFKAANTAKEEASMAIQKWYAKNRGESAEHELSAMLAGQLAY